MNLNFPIVDFPNCPKPQYPWFRMFFWVTCKEGGSDTCHVSPVKVFPNGKNFLRNCILRKKWILMLKCSSGELDLQTQWWNIPGISISFEWVRVATLCFLFFHFSAIRLPHPQPIQLIPPTPHPPQTKKTVSTYLERAFIIQSGAPGAYTNVLGRILCYYIFGAINK